MRRLVALFTLSCAAPLAAQAVVTSAEPEAVSLTVYHGGNGPSSIDKDWPTGYALITETRTVTIPAGESVIRFEGVAEGMFPESAIVTGLPEGVIEKNRDARLLSPQGLVDAYLKRQVTLTRTDKATGTVRTQDAFITAGPDGGVVLQTVDGYEALRCTGLPERLSYGSVPANLSAKPTLSVITSSDAPITARLTLTYMSAGFDWQANYIATVKDRTSGESQSGETRVDLFAWLTLANGGNQSFFNANTMAIAGDPNREDNAEPLPPTGGPLYIQCWPSQRTHQVPYNMPYINAPLPGSAEDIVVTAQRKASMLYESASPISVVMTAQQEDLGDLKLYRVPEPVTVNAKGQKQVAMLANPDVSFEHYYGDSISQNEIKNSPMALRLRSRNTKDKGLGLPMPQGPVMIFESGARGPLLIGEDDLYDRAVGDKVVMTVGDANDVRLSSTLKSRKKNKESWQIKVSNARNTPVNIEVEIPYAVKGKIKDAPKIDGVPTWKTTIPANGTAALNVTYDTRY